MGAAHNESRQKTDFGRQDAIRGLNGQFSPDGRWVAYETSESGRFEIVVQPFPAATGKWQVSTGGGIQARWRADGKESHDRHARNYDITADGKRIIRVVAADQNPASASSSAPQIHIVLNWFEELRKRVPVQ